MPFTLFCHEHSSNDAYEFFEENNALIEGDEEDWSATFEFDGKSKRKKMTVSFTYDLEWCSPPNWPRQVSGMQNYVAQFPMDNARRELVLRLVRKFRYCIGVMSEPEITDGDDPRFDVIHALAEHLNAVIFTPEALLDSHFRPICSADGEYEDEAVIPSVGDAPDPEYADEDEDVPEPEPPVASRVARRMYVLLATAARGLFEMNLKNGDEPAYTLKELHDWLEALDIDDEIEPDEREIIYTPAGKLSQQDTINSVWVLEGLVVLAWALKLAELPPYDELVDADSLMHGLYFLDVAGSKKILADAALRSNDDLEAYENEIFALDWRMVDYRVRPEACDYANVNIGYGKFDLSWADLVDGDLGLQGVAIMDADPNLVQVVSSASMERHKASNWLRGFETLYSQVGTDT